MDPFPRDKRKQSASLPRHCTAIGHIGRNRGIRGNNLSSSASCPSYAWIGLICSPFGLPSKMTDVYAINNYELFYTDVSHAS